MFVLEVGDGFLLFFKFYNLNFDVGLINNLFISLHLKWALSFLEN